MLPTAILGLTINNYIEEHFYNITSIAISFIVGGIAIILIENYANKQSRKLSSSGLTRGSSSDAAAILDPRVRPEDDGVKKITEVEQIDRKTAVKIGLFQCLSMIPGTSRSGATIMGSLLMGLDRRAAAEFSFFLAIPTIIGATVLNLYKTWGSIDDDAIHLILIGGIVSFITALFVVNGMIGFVSRNGFKPFAYYRIIAGALLLIFY